MEERVPTWWQTIAVRAWLATQAKAVKQVSQDNAYLNKKEKRILIVVPFKAALSYVRLKHLPVYW